MSKLPFPEKVLGSHIATLGKTGSGKSSGNYILNSPTSMKSAINIGQQFGRDFRHGIGVRLQASL